LFAPAIALSEEGFPITPRLHTLLQNDPLLRTDAVAAAYFYDPRGEPWPVGHRLKNPELAHVLHLVAQGGARAFYEGSVAQAVITSVGVGSDGRHAMSRKDLVGYEPAQRSPFCFLYPTSDTASLQFSVALTSRSLRVCGFPPPGSGAIAVGQILGMLTHTAADRLPPIRKTDFGTASASEGLGSEWLFLYSEAARLAFADRALYVADPAFVAPPAGDWLSLVDPAYLRFRASLIGTQRMKEAPAGDPAAFGKLQSRLGGIGWPYGAMAAQPEFGTSHISIMDGYGQAVAMTSSIEAAFGARRMVTTDPTRPGGFLLNNQLTDFSFLPFDAAGKPVANRVEPGKRPRSSMSPLLVLDAQTGAVVMSLGSPGGVQIIHYVAKTLYGMVHWGLSPQQAIDLPNIGFVNGPLLLEQGQFGPRVIAALHWRGLDVREVALTSGIHALRRSSQGIEGGADPRREGVVAGD
jgi:gamma-glutamyltranspeptidase/glutathione hydrolase